MDLNDYLSSAETAYYLKYAESTIRLSRVSGILGMKKAPSYIKCGGRIYYKKSVLVSWLKQFNEQSNTSQNS